MPEDTQRRVRSRRRQAGGLDDASSVEGDSDLNARVAGMVSPEPLSEEGPAPTVLSPEERLNIVGRNATAYEREYRLKLINRLIMRNVPLDVIAEQLGCSVSTVSRDRTELNKRMRQEAQNLDINELVGESIAFYKEISSAAMRSAFQSKLPMNVRIASMRTALASKNDMHKFLNTAGVYDVLRYRMAEEQQGSDIETLINLTEQLLSEEDLDLDNTEGLDALGGVDYDEDDEHIRIL